jgi:ABC-type cobalamin transport system permease subunit
VSFDGSSELSSSIVFSGVAIGTITGALLTRNFELSRRHVQLIDLGGILGVALGYSTATALAGNETVNEQTRTHFALAGLAVGILGSALLTRNLDDTRVPNITPELNSMLDSSGHRVSSLGFGVRF